MRIGVAAGLAMFLAGDACVDKVELADAPTTGSGISATAASTSGSPASSTAAGSTGGSTTSGSTASGSVGSSSTTSTATSGSTGSGASSTGNPTGGGFICPVNFGYVEGNCIPIGGACAGISAELPCLLQDGGLGSCFNGACSGLDLDTDPADCGQIGSICASDTTCANGACSGPDGGASSCDAGVCPAGTSCLSDFGSVCYYDQACQGAPPMASCVATPSSTETGFCCVGACLGPSQLAFDPNNCGFCGKVCPAGSLCEQSNCLPTSCSATSPAGSACALTDGGAAACCGGNCTDLSADPQNCGRCGAACPGNQSCARGTCALGCTLNSDCGPGEACLNEGTNTPTCYATACAPGETNTFCAIVVSPGTSVSGVCCAGACASFAADPQNCGGCGVVCSSGVCVNGACKAAPTDCTTQIPNTPCVAGANPGTCCGGGCTFNDDSNCGACGVICPVGSSCTNLAGAPQCAVGPQVVGCANTSQCGAGQICFPNLLGTGVCLGEACGAGSQGLSCALSDGGSGQCCAGRCSDLIADSENCQTCGAACPAGTICEGSLESDGPLANCVVPSNPNAEVCTAGSVCPAGDLCAESTGRCYAISCKGNDNGGPCVFGFSGGPLGGTCCGGKCVDLGTDSDNCGDCGIQCPTGACLGSDAYCYPEPASACAQSCGPGSACLGSSCVSVTCTGGQDFGVACPAEDGHLGTCAFTDAGALSCLDLANDPSNCGWLGDQCPSGQTCAKGLCSGTPAPCASLSQIGGFCDLDAGVGWNCCQGVGCVDLDDDPQNCGACGATCGSGQTCLQGVCQ